MIAWVKGLRCLCCSVLLTACATQQPDVIPPTPDTPVLSEQELWDAHRATVAVAEDWQARGKVGYRLPDDAGSASLRWQQRGQQSNLRLAGPLGANAVTLRSDGALISLTRDGIERLYPADAAPWLGDGRLLPIPVVSIRHWLRGIPDPDKPVTTLVTAGGLAQHIEQEGWAIRYENYGSSRSGALPKRLVVEAPDASLTLTVIVRQWDT